MLELGAGADILRALGWLYVGLMALLILAVLWFPRHWWQKTIGMVAVLLIFVGPAWIKSQQRSHLVDQYKAKYEMAQKLFAERCKSAGEKIYRKVEDVEGVLLTNTRGTFSIENYRDPNWAYAGFPGESSGSQYIMEFLFYNIPASGKALRSLGPTPGGMRGYSFVDVEVNGIRQRYRLRDQSDYSLVGFSDPVDRYGLRAPASKVVSTRYSISYENLNDSEARALWIAGGRIQVMDLETKEVLGEFVRYSFDPGLGDTSGERLAWLFSHQCPLSSYGGRTGHIRSFVEQVIRPKQGD